MPAILSSFRLASTWRRRVFLGGAAALTVLAVLVLGAQRRLDSVAAGRLFDDLAALPERPVGLVLGCARQLASGRENPFFRSRIDAAAALYRSGKVSFLLVSGDNHSPKYDEPTDMKSALADAGVPPERIYCDYAGFSTFDSLRRAQAVFGQEALTVVSQAFHNRRAVYIARELGIDAVGFNAREVVGADSARTLLREQLAVAKTLLDMEIWGREPRFLGEPIAIGFAAEGAAP